MKEKMCEPKFAVIDLGGRSRTPSGIDFASDAIQGCLGRHMVGFFQCHNAGLLVSGTFGKNVFRAIDEAVNDWRVIFIVSSFALFRKEEVREFTRVVEDSAKRKGIAVFYIVLDTMSDFNYFARVTPGTDMGDNREAIPLNVLPCLCGLQSVGSRRLVELMTRILGLDLPEPHFPNYSWEMLRLMATHINYENFNEGLPRIGAIPKYEFDQAGMPIIMEEMLADAFEKNVEEWMRSARKRKEEVLRKCPQCESRQFDTVDKKREIGRCSSCGISLNLSAAAT